MIAQIQMRRGTSAEWAEAEPVVLAAGEQGYDITLKSSKTGDGSTEWSSLPWSSGIEAIYPIGSIYMSVSSVSPDSLFGGTWEAWGAGRVPVGIDAGQAEFDTAEETGGSKTHVHSLEDGFSKIAVIDYSGDSYINWDEKPATWYPSFESKIAGGVRTGISSSPGIAAKLGGNTNSGPSLSPYIVCYMWKRTA